MDALLTAMGPCRHIKEGRLAFNESGEYPDWTKEVLGKLGHLCASVIGRGDTAKIMSYGIYLGFAEDNFDYYYRMFTKWKDNYQEIHETCVSGIRFLSVDDVADEDKELVNELLSKWEELKSQYIVE